MEFLTLEASDYESALRQARSQYGNAVRIHTRKDFSKGSVFAKQKRCVITFYLVEAKQQPPQNESASPVVFDAESYLSMLLFSNDVPPSLHQAAKQQLLAGNVERNQTEIEVELLQFLFEGVQFEDEITTKFAILLGSAGIGKTTTLIKTALYLTSQKGKKVALLSLDTQRSGSLGQIRQFAQEFSLPLYESASADDLARLLDDFAAYDHILVDTCGISAKDEQMKVFLTDMLSVLPSPMCSSYLVVSASCKGSDLLAQQDMFASHQLKAIICTKLDETKGIGTLLGFAQQSGLPLLSLTDGQAIPEDFHAASASYLMNRLQGFSLDLAQFFPSL